MKLQLVVEARGFTTTAEQHLQSHAAFVHPAHWRLLNYAPSTTRLMAFERRAQFSFSRSSWGGPATVSDENLAWLPVSLSLHLARIQPCCSKRCNAGYSEPCCTCNTS